MPPGGYWVPGNDLLTIKGAGLRGGYIPPDQDQDHERARAIERLRRVDWNPEDELQSIDDSSQIMFFQECGGFPLRALQGIEEMRLATRNTASKVGRRSIPCRTNWRSGTLTSCLPVLRP
jgi:hypothetical protein